MWDKPERNSIQNFRIFQKLLLTFTQKHTRPFFPNSGGVVPQKMDFLSPDQNNYLFIWTSDKKLCLSNRHFRPPDILMMTTMSKEWRDDHNRLSVKIISMNQIDIQNHIMSVWISPWMKIYSPFYLTTTTTLWTEETKKPPLFHDKELQNPPPPQQKWRTSKRKNGQAEVDIRSGPCR